MYKKIKNFSIKCVLAFLIISLSISPFSNAEGQRVLTEAQKRLQTKITYQCRELPIDTVLMQLAKITNATLEEALNNILAAHGFTYIPTENMVRVVPLSQVTGIPERLVTRIYQITYANIGDVAAALQNFISKQGELAINKGTSHIIVTDIESKISAIDGFIEQIDRPTPQVLVEVRIYDVTSTDRLDMGIEWSAGRTTNWGKDDEDSVPFPGSTSSRALTSGAHEPYGRGLFGGATGFTDDTTGALEFGILNSHLNINALLSMQTEILSATLLANPRVLVLDNETANFNIVREIPYEERSETSGSSGTLTTIQWKEVGIELCVTPHITRDGMIRLHILPEFGVVISLVQGTGAPTVDTRKLETTTLVKDFRFEGEEEVISEIIVFITPKIFITPTLFEDEDDKFDDTEFPSPVIPKRKAERDKEK
jgi:type II secretory pathway component GspD/PulD (secretin)